MNTDFYYHQTLTFIEDGVSLNVFDDYKTLNELLQNNNLKNQKLNFKLCLFFHLFFHIGYIVF